MAQEVPKWAVLPECVTAFRPDLFRKDYGIFPRETDAASRLMLLNKAKEQLDTANPFGHVRHMIEKLGLEPMWIMGKDASKIKPVYGRRSATDGELYAYEVPTPDAKGMMTPQAVPLDANFVGQALNPLLTSTANAVHAKHLEKGMAMTPSGMFFHQQQVKEAAVTHMPVDMTLYDKDNSDEENAQKTKLSVDKLRAGLTITTTDPITMDFPCDDYDAQYIIETVFGKGGLFMENFAECMSYQRNDLVLKTWFASVWTQVHQKLDKVEKQEKEKEKDGLPLMTDEEVGKFHADIKAEIKSNVLGALLAEKNGYYFARIPREGGTAKIECYSKPFIDKSKLDEKERKKVRDFNKYLNNDAAGGRNYDPNTQRSTYYDPTNLFTEIMKRHKNMMPKPIKITNLGGKEIGYGPDDQAAIHNLHNGFIVCCTFRPQVFRDSYGSVHLGMQPDSSGYRILLDGPEYTENEEARLRDYLKNGITMQGGNAAMSADLTTVVADKSSEQYAAATQALKEREARKRKALGLPDEPGSSPQKLCLTAAEATKNLAVAEQAGLSATEAADLQADLQHMEEAADTDLEDTE